MRNIFFICIYFLLAGNFAQAQTADSVRWKVSAEKKSANEVELIFSTLIPSGKWIYVDQDLQEESLFPVIELADRSVSFSDSLTIAPPLYSYSDPLFDGRSVSVVKDSLVIRKTIKWPDQLPAFIKGQLIYTIAGADEFLPGNMVEFNLAVAGGADDRFDILKESILIHQPVTDCGDETTKGKSIWTIFLLGLLGGFIALLTPCVFPLMPLTVSFFTKKADSRRQAVMRAFLYGFFILVIYIVLSFPFHLLDSINPELLNNISTNVWLNLFFFLVFVFFAVSFFGYFDITLPSGLVANADAKSSLKTSGGIFFMALTLVIVSFSCTGPILGSLLVGSLSAEGGAWQLTAGMAGFGLGLALPFALLASFPHALQSLPKSGSWLNTVKVILGFVELAMAIKFFSNADLVEQWGILKREIFIAVWAIIGIAILLYLGGVIRFPHDDRKPALNRGRLMSMVVFSVMVLYLLPGIFNSKYARLSLISGFPPPVCYSVYEEPVNCRNDIEPVKDYVTALDKARLEKKPLLVDFTGWACVNCRRMEEQVWTDTEVKKMIRENFVIVSLYVDERRVLKASQQQTYLTKAGLKKDIITVGDQWATFQSENFEAVSQPQYAILSHDEKLLTGTKGYTPDPAEFLQWLECGLKAYRSLK
jgi:cytochrome c biogenesis protein CcdA/thioredoxin-related protein